MKKITLEITIYDNSNLKEALIEAAEVIGDMRPIYFIDEGFTIGGDLVTVEVINVSKYIKAPKL